MVRRLTAGGGSHERTRLCLKIPCWQRICREFHSIRLLGGTSGAQNVNWSNRLRGQFPTHPNRELFAALQGIQSGYQGTLRRDQGIPLVRYFCRPIRSSREISMLQIARRARWRERRAFRALRWRHRSHRAPPVAPSSTVAGGPRVRIRCGRLMTMQGVYENGSGTLAAEL